jgi:hypothetical protein
VKRVVTTTAVLLALVAAVVVMREATQNRPDIVAAGSTTTIDFDVSTSRFQRGEPAAAIALWAVCSSTVGGTVSPVPEAHDGAWRVRVSPSIGEHGENRLVGCLEDVTIDRVIGDVLALSTAP